MGGCRGQKNKTPPQPPTPPQKKQFKWPPENAVFATFHFAGGTLVPLLHCGVELGGVGGVGSCSEEDAVFGVSSEAAKC